MTRQEDPGEMRRVAISKEGLQKIQEELDYLKNVRRKEVAERLKEARALGDLSENAEYQEARNEQAFLEGRIAQLEEILRNASVVDGSESTEDGAVRLYSRLRVRDLDTGEEFECQIVGPAEVDPAQGKLSAHAPFGQAVLGKHAGEVVDVQAPAGIVRYLILEVWS